jgi:hypothetical protein
VLLFLVRQKHFYKKIYLFSYEFFIFEILSGFSTFIMSLCKCLLLFCIYLRNFINTHWWCAQFKYRNTYQNLYRWSSISQKKINIYIFTYKWLIYKILFFEYNIIIKCICSIFFIFNLFILFQKNTKYNTIMFVLHD